MNSFEKEFTKNKKEPVEEKELDDITAKTQGQDKIKYGKFADADSLYEAYQNLEREFTKKSQKLSQLQNKINCDNGKTLPPQQYDSLDNFDTQNPTEVWQDVDNPAQNANVLLPSQLVQDQNFLEEYVFSNEDIMQQVLQRYLDVLAKNDLPHTINSRRGAMSLTPPKRPKTIKEASVLAQKIFNK